MGNSFSDVRTSSLVIEGTLENGTDALNYSWENNRSFNFKIQEFSPNGITSTNSKSAKSGNINWKCGKNINTGKGSIPLKNEKNHSTGEENLKSGKAKFLSEVPNGFSDTGLHQDILNDVVYSVRHLFEEHFNNSDRHLQNGIHRTVSIDLEAGLKASQSVLSTDLRSLRLHSNRLSNTKDSQLTTSDGFDLIETLKSLFDVDEFIILNSLNEMKKRKTPNKRVIFEIVEAKNLRPKSQKDTSNPYCVIRIGYNPTSKPLTELPETFKTQVTYESLHPSWKSKFSLDCDDTYKKIYFEVWHAPMEKHLVDKIPLKGLRKEARNLLGSASLDLQNLTFSPIDKWLKLTKCKTDDTSTGKSSQMKERGEIHVKITIEEDVLFLSKDKQNFRCLLIAIARSHDDMFWDGTLSPSEKVLIYNYCKTFNISSQLTAINWWLVLSSEEMKISQKYLCSLAVHLKKYFEKYKCDEDKDGEILTNSIVNWMNFQVTKIKELHTFYPVDSEVHSKNQLMYSLRTLKQLEDGMPSHLLSKTVHPFNLCIAEALEDFLESWWKKTYTSRQWFTPSEEENNILNSLNDNRSSGLLESNHIATLSQFRATNYNFYRSFHGRDNKMSYVLNKLKRRCSLDNSTKISSCFSHQPLLVLKPEGKNHDLQNDALTDLELAVECVVEVNKILQDISNIYNSIFYKEYKIPFFRQSFIYLGNELASMLEPLLCQLYERYNPNDKIEVRTDPLALEFGTPIYQIYTTLRKIEQLSSTYVFSSEIEIQSGLKCYWKWLSKGVRLWLQRTYLRAKENIIKDVQEETFLDESQCPFSATSAIEIHEMILNAWISLKWPLEDIKSEWLLKITESLCSLSHLYGSELNIKLSSVLRQSERNVRSEINNGRKVCVAINNLTLVCDAVKKLPEIMEPRCPILYKYSKEKIDRQIDNTCLGLESITRKIMTKMVEKLRPRTIVCIIHSCQVESISPLQEHFDKEILSKRNILAEKKFLEYLDTISKDNLNSFKDIIKRNRRIQSHSFFVWLSQCLERSVILMKNENSNINFDDNKTYERIRNHLKYLKKTDESLMVNYYNQRFKEQHSNCIVAVGELAIRASISAKGILTVNVILAKYLQLPHHNGIKSLLFGIDESKNKKSLPNSYVTLRLVPQQKFPKFTTFKTKVQKRTADPVYDMNFEFALNIQETETLDNGFILASIYNRECISIDQFIGETILPLNRIPQIESNLLTSDITIKNANVNATSCQTCKTVKKQSLTSTPLNSLNQVENMFLNITTPKLAEGYVSLRTLKLRSWEKNTQKLLKDLKIK